MVLGATSRAAAISAKALVRTIRRSLNVSRRLFISDAIYAIGITTVNVYQMGKTPSSCEPLLILRISACQLASELDAHAHDHL